VAPLPQVPAVLQASLRRRVMSVVLRVPAWLPAPMRLRVSLLQVVVAPPGRPAL
jgi:hypothetical protein